MSQILPAYFKGPGPENFQPDKLQALGAEAQGWGGEECAVPFAEVLEDPGPQILVQCTQKS